MRKIVITGATGSLGRALIDEAVSRNYEVLVICNPTSNRAEELSAISGCRIAKIDLSDYKYGKAILNEQGIETSGYDTFFHLSWMSSFGKGRDDLSVQLKNVEAAVEAANLAHQLGCLTFIGTGSQAEYGRKTEALSPTTLPTPETGYGIAKLSAGYMTRLVCEQFGMRHFWARILSIYGPYDRDQTLISYAISSMLHNEDTEFTACEQIWDYIYSYDAAKCMLAVMESNNPGAIFVLGSGKTRLLKNYIEVIAEQTHYKKRIGFGKKDYPHKQVMYLKADISFLVYDIGICPNTPFEEGIAKTIKWKLSKENIA